MEFMAEIQTAAFWAGLLSIIIVNISSRRLIISLAILLEGRLGCCSG